jgi:hypothetical protein
MEDFAPHRYRRHWVRNAVQKVDFWCDRFETQQGCVHEQEQVGGAIRRICYSLWVVFLGQAGATRRQKKPKKLRRVWWQVKKLHKATAELYTPFAPFVRLVGAQQPTPLAYPLLNERFVVQALCLEPLICFSW